MTSSHQPSDIRRKLVLGASATLASAPFGALAQGLSNKPVRIILGQTTATTPDLIARDLVKSGETELLDLVTQ